MAPGVIPTDIDLRCEVGVAGDDAVDAASEAEEILLGRRHVVVDGIVAEGRLLHIIQTKEQRSMGRCQTRHRCFHWLTTDGDTWLWWHSPALQPNLQFQSIKKYHYNQIQPSMNHNTSDNNTSDK